MHAVEVEVFRDGIEAPPDLREVSGAVGAMLCSCSEGCVVTRLAYDCAAGSEMVGMQHNGCGARTDGGGAQVVSMIGAGERALW